MREDATARQPSPRSLLDLVRPAKQENDWPAIAALAEHLPVPLEPAWLGVADDVAFAFGQLRHWKVAMALTESAYELEPTWRRASSLAYLYYDASLALVGPQRPKPDMDRETLRQGFRTWIGKALEHDPDSIKDLYRLGVFEAQVESTRDKPALKSFLRAIELYRNLPEPERARRGDLRKACTKALYAGARSALRLGQSDLARKLCFACIREDEGVDHVDPVHKMHQAARVCLATGQFDHAERAARIALDAKGPPRRDYLFCLLADICLRREDPRSAASWIESHVPARRRDSATWRKLGDARLAAGDGQGARLAWESALQRDRCGRHLTLVRLGKSWLEAGELGKAEDAFRKAADFRKSRYMREDEEALRGLEKVLEARGKQDDLGRVRARLAKTRPADHPPEGLFEPEENVA